MDFQHDVAPLIKRHCTACHSGDSPAGRLELTGEPTEHFDKAYENLQTPEAGRTPEQGGKYIHLGSARESLLIHLFYGWKGKSMPDDHPLSDEERKTFVEWIDIGARWDNHPEP